MTIGQIITRGLGPGGSIAGIVTAGLIASTSDTTPDAFFFTSVPSAIPGTVYTSNTITVAGIDVAVPYSVTGGLVSKNGGAFTNSSGTAVLGDTFALQLTSSPIGSTLTTAALTIGGVTGSYSVTTAAGTSVTYNWTLTREKLCDRALMKCGVLAAGEAAEADDRALCIEALESILKNLVWRGYHWPKTSSSSTTISLLANTQNIQLPVDLYKTNAINYLDDKSNEVLITLIDFPTYKRLHKKDQVGTPQWGYIDNYNVLWVYPVQETTKSAKLYYEKIAEDSVAATSVELDSPWMLGLIYGICTEIGDEFGVPAQKMARFEAKWAQQLTLGIQNEAAPTPDRVLMDD